MALVVKDRIKETSSTTGQSDLTLTGAVDGFRTFADIGNNNTTYYAIVDGNNFEVGLGTYSTSGPTLARTTVLQTSAGNTTKISCTGNQEVFVTQPADKAVFEDASDNVTFTNNINVGTSSKTTDTDVKLINDNKTFGIRADRAGSYFSVVDFSAGQNRLVIDTSGNVGLGESNPQTKLHIDTETSGLPRIRLDHQNSSAEVFEIGGGVDGITNSGYSLRNVTDSLNAYYIDASNNHVFNTASITQSGSNPTFNIETSWSSGNYGQLRLGYIAGDDRSITGHYDDGIKIKINSNTHTFDTQGRLGLGVDPANARGGYTDLVIGEGGETGQGSTQPQIELYHSSASWAINNDSTNSNQMGFHYNNGSSWSQILALKSGTVSEFSGDIQAAGMYVGSANTSYDFYNNGTSYFNGTVDVDERLTAQALSLSDNGVSGVILNVRTDDDGPWAMRVGNDTVGTSAGYSFYQHSNGTCNHYSYGNGAYVNTLFHTSDGSGNVTYMTVDTNGCVNITPGTGHGSNDASFYVNSPSGNDWGMIVNKASGDYGIDLRGTTGSYAFRLLGNSVEKFRITWDGTVVFSDGTTQSSAGVSAGKALAYGLIF